MLSLLAAIGGHDLDVLFVILAVVAFGLAILAGFRGSIEAAVALALLGVIILVVT